VDATARRDPSVALVPNAWLGLLPEHAVICDLAVDPYLLDDTPRMAVFARRFAPARCVPLEAGTRIDVPADGAWPPGIRTIEAA
jgi:hypothetical protein